MKKLIKKLCMYIAKSDKLSNIFYAPPFNKLMYKIHNWSCNKNNQQYQNDLMEIIDTWYGEKIY